MQVEHEENSPPEEKRSRDKTGTPQAQTPFAAPVLLEDSVKTRSMEQSEKDQDERADAERRDRLVFVRNFGQECRNINPAVSRAASHGSTS